MREPCVGVELLHLLSYLCTQFGWLCPVDWGSPAPEALLLLMVRRIYSLSLLYILNIRN